HPDLDPDPQLPRPRQDDQPHLHLPERGHRDPVRGGPGVLPALGRPVARRRRCAPAARLEGVTVSRIVGIETEYGILGVRAPAATPMLLSAQVVTAYANEGIAGGARARWDYQDEDPLCDARGWRLDRDLAHPSQLTDADAWEAAGADG